MFEQEAPKLMQNMTGDDAPGDIASCDLIQGSDMLRWEG